MLTGGRDLGERKSNPKYILKRNTSVYDRLLNVRGKDNSRIFTNAYWQWCNNKENNVTVIII